MTKAKKSFLKVNLLTTTETAPHQCYTHSHYSRRYLIIRFLGSPHEEACSTQEVDPRRSCSHEHQIYIMPNVPLYDNA